MLRFVLEFPGVLIDQEYYPWDGARRTRKGELTLVDLGSNLGGTGCWCWIVAGGVGWSHVVLDGRRW